MDLSEIGKQIVITGDSIRQRYLSAQPWHEGLFLLTCILFMVEEVCQKLKKSPQYDGPMKQKNKQRCLKIDNFFEERYLDTLIYKVCHKKQEMATMKGCSSH